VDNNGGIWHILAIRVGFGELNGPVRSGEPGMDYADMSDDDLIRRFREGDEHAFWELYRRFKPPCFNLKGGPRPQWLCKVPSALIWSHLTEFENLFQRVLEDTAKRTYKFGGPAKYRTYLQRALRNRVCDWFRGRDPEPEPLRPDWPAPQRDDPAWPAERLEHVDSVYDCIDELSENARAMIERHYTRGETLAQIARDIGIQPDTCRKRHERAIERLRKCLARKGFRFRSET